MLDVRDPAIKLFGKTIPVAGEGEESSPRDSNDSSNSSEQQEPEKELAEEESMEIDQLDDPSPPAKDDSSNPPTVPEANDDLKEPDSEKDSESPKDEKDSNDSKNSQQKPLKKPDKILPCPRCNSMDTKFCYYNNYNINQPRHFCKSCQRYWTAGGTMRNVPVGAGRRKNKSSASRYCHITVSEALQAARFDVPNGVHHPGLKTNGTVLTFGSENPLCESMASVLNIADKKVQNATARNGFHSIEHVVPVPCRTRENEDHSSGSTVTTSSMEDGAKRGPQEQMNQNLNGFPNQIPCFQWPYMWNPAVPVPPFCPSGFPMSFYPPPPYWNGAIPWNMPWVSPCTPSSPGQKSPGSNPNSPLGKHTRDGEVLKPSDNEKGSGTTTSATTTTTTTTTTVLVPKTLRIDDPDEAAKSSIWTTLGINKEKGDPKKKGGFFNNFQGKGEEKDHKMEAPPALKANPAALCRSMSFQESSSR